MAATTVTYQTDLSALDDASLTSALNRAWREASRAWSDFRREPATSPIKAMLLTSADAAEDWWELLREEQRSRDFEAPVEVRSDDGYTVTDEPEDGTVVEFALPDGGTTTIPQEPKAPVSPWVRNAASKTLPGKSFDRFSPDEATR